MSKSNRSQMLEQELMKTESEMTRDFLLEKLIWNYIMTSVILCILKNPQIHHKK